VEAAPTNVLANGVPSVLILTIAYTHSNIARQVMPMFVGPIQTDLGLSDIGISLAGGFAFALWYSVMGVPLGRLVDTANRRRLIIIGVMVWSAMTALCGLSNAFALFILGRVGLGLSEAVVIPASLSILHDLYPRRRLALATSTFFTGAWFGNGVAFILGAWILAHPSTTAPSWLGLSSLRSWQIAFLAVAAAGVPVGLLCLCLREPERADDGFQHAGAPGTWRARPALDAMLRHLGAHVRLYAGIVIGITVYSAAVSGAAFWAVEYFVRTFGSDRSEVGYLYGLQGVVAGPLGLTLAGWLADRAEMRGTADAKLRVAIASLLVLLPLGGLFFAVDSERSAMILYVAVTLLTPIAYGTGAAALQSATPGTAQGLVLGLYTFMTNAVGMGLGPTMVAMASKMFQQSGHEVSWGIAIVIVITIPFAVVMLGLAMKPYRQMIARTESRMGGPS
jgi:MFS family permease